MSTQLYPEVLDLTNVTAVFSSAQFLGIGIEGQAASAGSATVGQRYSIMRGGDADTYFGAGSNLALLVRFLLDRGVGVVDAVASIKSSSAPDLTARKAAWEALEESRDVRIRLTDSTTTADLAALAVSCTWADDIQHKQICIVGMPTTTTASAYSTAVATLQAAGAAAASRCVLVAPGVYDEGGTLRSGAYTAAAVAALVSSNRDLSDDLDTVTVPQLSDVERTASGVSMFRIKAGAGTPVNDYEEALQDGVSPLRPGVAAGVEITHLRTTYIVDTRYDALMTRLVEDQLFEEVRGAVEDARLLRLGNTAKNRGRLAAIVESRLQSLNEWVEPVLLSNGLYGYGVTVLSTGGGRQMAISYRGNIVRNTQTVAVEGHLTIAA